MRTAGAFIIIAMAIAGCASHPHTTPGTAARTASALPPGAAQACGWPDDTSRLVSLRTADGVRLAGYEAGTGPRGILLLPEAGRLGACGWWPFAAYLASRGFRVLAFSHRCQADSGCPATTAPNGLMTDITAALARLRADGSTRVALTGASQGGTEALIFASRPASGITGAAIVSADELDTPLATAPWPVTGDAAAGSVRLPVFAAVGADDPYVSVAGTRHLTARLPGLAHLTVIAGTSGHGWDLVNAVQGAPPPALAASVAAFLLGVTR